MINVFRFHAPASIAPDHAVKRLTKRKLRKAMDVTLMAADTHTLTDGCGRRAIECYADLGGKSCVTLTRKEADLIALANPGLRPPLALEDLHPWLPRQSYNESSEKNYYNLQDVFRRFSQNLVAPAEYCDEKWKKVYNAVRLKTELDARFYTAWHLPLQDSYLLEERRQDRRVIALDFNAMYPFCMQQEFPKPSKMRHVVYGRDIALGEVLPAGLFRCTLQGSSSNFIRKYNPFRAFFAGRHLRAALTEGLSVDLHEFEVEFYQKHFSRVYIADAIISDQCISHPLARDAKRSFARRLHYLAHDNKALADREKFLSTLLASATQRPGRSRQLFATPALAQNYLLERFGIVPSADDPANLSATWLQGRKGLIVSKTSEGVLCDTSDLSSGRACFVFNQRIVALGRIKVLKMMEKVAEIAPDVEVCYVNIDSIHFSIPAAYLTSTLNSLRPGVSDRMGDYKIEAVTRNGLWLEPGRYWLYSDDIEKSRNQTVGNRRNAFADHSIYVVSRQIGDLHVPIRMTVTMERTISDTRSIIDDPVTGLARQQLVAIGNNTTTSDVLASLERNRAKCIPRRMQAFRQLEALLGNCQVSLPRDLTV